MKRIESGPVQFGEDWPGLFLRGDHAFELAQAIALLLKDPTDLGAQITLSHIRDLCFQVDQRSVEKKLKLKPIAECLEAR